MTNPTTAPRWPWKWPGRKPAPGVALGLQGGGAHGAFTWGVLDALLQEPRLHLCGISGTSAGAMNAVALAQGMMTGGPQGAQQALEAFWTAVAAQVPFELASLTHNGQRVVLSPAARLMMQWAQWFSPAQLNPLGANPLRDVLLAQVDFERLRNHSPFPLFIAATHAQTGQLRLFREHELSADAVLASACLPNLHHTVEVDGQPYWDGGYAANPAVRPLLKLPAAPDVLLVLLSPLQHAHPPTDVAGIRHRTLEFAFNGAFLREMRLLAQEQHEAQAHWLRLAPFERRLATTRFHLMEAPPQLSDLGTESKLVATLPIFKHLMRMGQAHARAWLQTNAEQLGRRSTVNLAQVFGED